MPSRLFLMRRADSDRLLAACLAAALLLHILLIFCLTFVAPRGDRAQIQDVTVAVQLQQDKNPQADFLAQANQQGGGILDKAARKTAPSPSPDSRDGEPNEQQMAQQTETPPVPTPASAANEQPIVVTRLSWKEEQRRKRKTARPTPASPDTPSLMAQQAAEVAALEAQYHQLKQAYSHISRIETVDSESTQASDSAGYLERFRRQVERAGNRDVLQLPQGLHGDVRLMVIVRPDGSIRAIRLLGSSGSTQLDEAAKNSVRRAAPFDRFDAKMRDLSELRIIRTWRFDAQQDQVDVRAR